MSLGLAKQSVKNMGDPLTYKQHKHTPITALPETVSANTDMPNLWLLITYCYLWGKDFLIHGDAQRYDGVNSSLQSTCWITAASKQTISPN